ncbi:hypothetical protein [Candidatus Villigracilis proximus]|uniref:hypothetical protein n=1 Tax=Candidatus Villigracilis proximus TaxID=3140683 RepID=UPI0031E9CF3E
MRPFKECRTAESEFIVHGVVTNIDFMQAVLKHEDFAQGKISTRWVELNMELIMESNSLLFDLQMQEQAPALHSLIAAALTDVVFAGTKSQPAVSNETDPFNPWKQTNNYRVSDQ